MRTEIEQRLLDIIRSVVTDKDRLIAPVYDDFGPCDNTSYGVAAKKIEGMEPVFALAKKHQLQHLVAYYMYASGDLRLAKRFYSSVSFTLHQARSADEISEALSEARIKHVPLKGTVLRKLYSEEWMRNSCDIDVLVSEGDLENAGKVLEALGYVKQDGLSAHDVTYERGRIHVELHYLLLEEYRLEGVGCVLSEVWQHCTFDGGYTGVMSDEFFYFYHIAHMAKHFELGGCGVRTVLDTWILNHRCGFDALRRRALLVKGGLDKFEAGVNNLAESWFGEGKVAVIDGLEEFVLSGGAYGTVKNSVEVSRGMRGGRISYIIHRLFAPYSQLKRYYPFLDGKPYLLPVFEVKRWLDALSRDKKKYFYEMRESIKKEGQNTKTNNMLTDLGLNKIGETENENDN